jgi:hypothetical protein
MTDYGDDDLLDAWDAHSHAICVNAENVAREVVFRITKLKAEVARMRPVVEAAVKERNTPHGTYGISYGARAALRLAIDAYDADEPTPEPPAVPRPSGLPCERGEDMAPIGGYPTVAYYEALKRVLGNHGTATAAHRVDNWSALYDYAEQVTTERDSMAADCAALGRSLTAATDALERVTADRDEARAELRKTTTTDDRET